MDSVRTQTQSFPNRIGAEYLNANSVRCPNSLASNGGEGESTGSIGHASPRLADSFSAGASQTVSDSEIWRQLNQIRLDSVSANGANNVASASETNSDNITAGASETNGANNVAGASETNPQPASDAPAPPDANGVADVTLDGAGLAFDVVCENAQYLGVAAAASQIGGILGSGIFWAAGSVLGGAELAHGIRHRDPQSINNAASHLLDSTGRGMDAVSMLTQSSSRAALKTVGQAAGKLAGPLSVASAAVDVAIGTKDIIEGAKNHDKGSIIRGAFDVGFGAAMAACVFGAGVPAIAIGGVALIGKIALTVKDVIAAHHQQNQG